MPMRHEPQSLRESALEAIADNFDCLCFGATPQQAAQIVEQGETYRSAPNPFTDLPAVLVEELTEQLKRRGRLRRRHLYLLITARMTSCALDGIAEYRAAADLIAHRCTSLKHLNLSYQRYFNGNMLTTLLPCFSTLVTLNLRMTMTMDQMLAQVGANCPLLRDLNVSSTPVGDRGLVQLCVSPEGRRQCVKLTRLSVAETCVSVAGATVALHTLTNLTDFDFDNIFEALQQLEVWDRGMEARLLTSAGCRLPAAVSAAPQRLALRSLTSSAEYVAMDAIQAAVNLCPDATSIVLSNSWLPSEALYKFMVLEHLTALSITNGEGLTLDFQEGVLPLLSTCGPKLENLILTNFTYIDIAGIGRTCAVLRNLALSGISTMERPAADADPTWFSKLQALELWSEPTADVSPQLLKQLLVSPHLRNLLFTGCSVFTDELIEQVLQVNPLRHLAHLTLDQCHGVTAAALHSLLDADNELSVLRIWRCACVNKERSLELARRVRAENMDLYLDWYPDD